MNAKYICATLAVLGMQAIFASAGAPDWVPAELIAMVQEDKKRCMAEHGTTEEMIERMNTGDFENEPPISCYMYCLLDSFGMADDDGNLEAEMLMGVLPENLLELADKILAACAKQDGANPCDRVYNIAKCVQGEVPELWFMV